MSIVMGFMGLIGCFICIMCFCNRRSRTTAGFIPLGNANVANVGYAPPPSTMICTVPAQAYAEAPVQAIPQTYVPTMAIPQAAAMTQVPTLAQDAAPKNDSVLAQASVPLQASHPASDGLGSSTFVSQGKMPLKMPEV